MTREIALHCMKSNSELHSDLCELCPIYGETGSDHCFEDALQYVIGMLEQEPRKGHWIYTPQRRLVDETDDGYVYETYYRCSCSECGGDFGFIRGEDSFCKYCGADMREVEE